MKTPEWLRRWARRVAGPDPAVAKQIGRAGMAESQRDAAQAKAEQLREQLQETLGLLYGVRAELAGTRNVEPESVEGCVKVRLRDRDEADRFRSKLAGETGLTPDDFKVYSCKTCPRQWDGSARFLHVANRNPSQRTGRREHPWTADEASRRGRERAEGRQLGQRIDPAVLSRLRGDAS